jgi:hypothetical protein
MAGSYALNSGSGVITVANAAVTLAFLNPIASPNLDFTFMRFWCGWASTIVSTRQRVQLNTQVTAFPTVVAATPAKLSVADSASLITGGTAGAAGTCGINASAEGAGAKTILWPDTFDLQVGWLMVPTPDEQIQMTSGAASGLGFHLPVSPTPSLIGWVFGMSWNED